VPRVRSDKTRVLLARGHHPTPWGLGPWGRLPSRFHPRVLVTGSSRFDLEQTSVEQARVRALRDRIPSGLAGDLATQLAGDRYLGIEEELDAADIVHSEDLSLWFSAQLARERRRRDFKLVVTVWETIPLMRSYRTFAARRYRSQTLAGADLFLAATERARDGLLLEGVPGERIRVSYPGVDIDRFAHAAAVGSPEHYTVVSPGRLEWEKGHHDVMRAVAALRRGIVSAPEHARERLRLRLIGSGPDEQRLHDHARELGIDDIVEFGSLPYAEMPALFATASCVVLASLPRSGCSVTPGGPPHCFWEEQFGMVLAESMAARVPVVVSRSGAIPEVVGEEGTYFDPGDWMGIARALAGGPLKGEPAARRDYPEERVRRYSVDAAAGRIADAYDSLTAAR
jgi:glycosyltransferase involved in cell wall biosynthesis